MMFDHEDPVKILSDDESWKLLEHARHGRLVVSAVGEIDVFPINYYAHDGVLLMRTTPGTKLAELKINNRVVFEADGISSEDAWSVVAKGTARIIEKQTEIDEADKVPLETWLPTLKYVYVEIKPEVLSGRHFIFGAEPERYWTPS